MTNGTTQGIFILLAIVIFGIFVLISYMLYQDKMKTGLTAIMCDAMTITSKNTGFELPDKDCTATFPNEEGNEDSDNSEIPTGLQYYKIRDSNEERNESEVWVLIEHEDSENVRIIDSGDSDGFTPETFGQDLDGIISFPDKIEQWNITHIDKHSFEEAKFSEIMKLPDELLVLDDYSLKQSVFSGEATFPENLEIIGIEALRDSRFTGGLDTLPNIKEIRENALQESEFEDSDLSELGKNSEELVLKEGSLGKYKPTGVLKLPDNLTELGSVTTEGSNNTQGTNVLDSSNITSIDFGNSSELKVIGDNIFKDAKITGALKIPTSVQAIGKDSFTNSQITELDLSNNKELTVIGDNAFKNSRITKLVLPKDSKLKTIGKDAFKESNITQLDLKEAVELEEIGDGAFENSRLTGILFLPDSVKRVGDRAFYTAVFNNKDWKTPTKLEYIGDYAFYNSRFTGDLFLNNSNNLKHIGDYSYYNSFYSAIIGNVGKVNGGDSETYKTVHRLYLPNSVEYIGDYSFYNSGFDSSFRIPEQTKYIGDYAFFSGFGAFRVMKLRNTFNDGGFYYYSIRPYFYFNENIEYIGTRAFFSAHFGYSDNANAQPTPFKLHTIGTSAFRYSFGTYSKSSTYRTLNYFASARDVPYDKSNIRVGTALKIHGLENVTVVRQ